MNPQDGYTSSLSGEDSFILDRFAFAARTIEAYTRDFGKARARQMIAVDLSVWSFYARQAFLTAFGG